MVEDDYKKLGLRVGLELHQQLNTSEKLFCSCKTQLFKGKPEFTFIRSLRPSQSELGQIDPAALFEFQKVMKIQYEGSKETNCLVEMDEEPPHRLNDEAVEIAMMTALVIGAEPIDEIQVMRKMVIDGSNTTGFQRTCVIALGGEVVVDGKKIPIQHVSLEEDAARKMGEQNDRIKYRIDRLGIPLIEVTTAPFISSPEEAEKTAITVGRILRATRRVKRGLGTIRQDVNISIEGGALIEVKGVQKLELVSKVVEYEVQRQLNLLKIREELIKRGVTEEDIGEEISDITFVFNKTKCQVIRKALERHKKVLALKLPKFAGLLKRELMSGVRFGSEMAEIARFWGNVDGIFHTDELPAFGITLEEVNKVKKIVKTKTQDVVVFVADVPQNASEALKAIAKRAGETIVGVPEETRVANPDGTTRYMRPRPGSARMYPETDVPPIRISEEHLNKLRIYLPRLPEEEMRDLIDSYDLNTKLAKQILDSEYDNLFRRIVKETKVSSSVIAVTLTETIKALKRDGVKVDNLNVEQIRELFHLIDTGKIAKEAIPEVMIWLSEHKGRTAREAVDKMGLTMISEKKLEKMIKEMVEENEDLIMKKGKAAYGLLMGLIMKKVRGRVKAKLVGEILKRELKKEDS